MVIEQPLVFSEWIGPAIVQWGSFVAAFALGALFVAFLLAAAQYGPIQAGDRIYSTIVSGLGDLLHTSPRRVFALARLAIKESLRRRVIVALGVFVVVLAFAVWFLDTETLDPSGLYLSFVLNATTYLILLLTLFVSSFSLPADIKNKTIYTIVTKPVRPTEIVLGRILGFVAIGTVLLAVMGVANYFFVTRALDHTHTISEEDFVANEDGSKEGRTSRESGHRHRVSILPDGTAIVEPANGHRHDITIDESKSGDDRYVLSEPVDQLTARVPIYGKLSFIDSQGNPTNKGINVGNEWMYRSYIEGGSEYNAAIWRFSGVRREDFPEGIPIELTLRVFRSYKGQIDRGIAGSLVIRNPKNHRVRSAEQIFIAKEFYTDRQHIPLKLASADRTRTLDLFDDLMEDGEFEVILQCLQPAQYFGVAQADLYLLPREASFEWNFVKVHLGVWLQMALLASFGVMWSTFLNAAVAMLATASTLVGGFFASFLHALVRNEVEGGGPVESLIRLATQRGIVTELDAGTTGVVAQSVDYLARGPLMVISKILPDFTHLSDIGFISAGYNIPMDVLLIQIVTVLGYFIPVYLAACLFLKVREVAK